MSTSHSLKKEFTLLGILAVILVATGIGYAFAYNYIAGIQKENREREESIATVNASLLETNELKDIIERTQEDREKINSYFVTPDTINQFFGELEGIGETLGVEVVIASADEQTTASGKTELAVKLSSSGLFHEVYGFLLMLENLPFEIRIKEMRLSQSDTPLIALGGSGISDVRPLGSPLIEAPIEQAEPLYAWRGDFSIVLESFIDTE